jgi:hypothetical protein
MLLVHSIKQHVHNCLLVINMFWKASGNNPGLVQLYQDQLLHSIDVLKISK